jgi:DDE superfamily endonuclease
LIGPGDRKSIGPMAERVAPGDYDRLHHFVSDGVWDEAPLECERSAEADVRPPRRKSGFDPRRKVGCLAASSVLTAVRAVAN